MYKWGWKAIFKVSILFLNENEERLLDMPFEQILSQINTMPVRFVLEESLNSKEKRARFDKQMKIKVPTILLERLRREYLESVN